MAAPRSFVARLRGAALAAVVCLAAGAAGSAGAADIDPRRFVDELGTSALDTLTVAQITDEERERRFRDLFVAHFDVPAIGRTVLGRYWRSATPEQRAEYLDLFEDFIVKTYASRFKQYTGDGIAVQGVLEDREGYATVHSIVDAPSGDEVQVLWRVRNRDDRLWIVDVVVEGVSMIITQQRDFASVVQRHGGQVDGLIGELRRKTETMN